MTASMFGKVTRQEKPISSSESPDKKSGVVSHHSFCLRDLFGLSGPEGTNISQRCDMFFTRFLEAASHKCQPPKEVIPCDYAPNAFKAFFIQQLLESKEMLWNIRVPVKLVGKYILHQAKGEEGELLTRENTANIFLSRGVQDVVYVVKASFVRTSWQVESYEANLGSLKSILGNHQVVRFFSGQR